MISDRSARLINAKDYGIKVGSQAEVTVIDAKSPAEAVATNAPVLAVFKRGRQTVSPPARGTAAPAVGLPASCRRAHACLICRNARAALRHSLTAARSRSGWATTKP